MYKILYVLVISAVFFACSSNKEQKDNQVRPVKIGQVYKSADEPVDILSGTVIAGTEANPSFSVVGLLKKIYVKEGDAIKSGTLIAEIDAADYKSAFDAAESKYNQVNAQVARVEELFKKNTVTKNEYEQAVSGRQTVASLYETAKNQLQSTKLYSPISGIVQSINAGLYQTIMPGIGVITIVNTETLSVETNISSALYVQKGQFKEFVGYSSFVQEPIPLKLNFIAPKANNSQLYKVILQIDSKYVKKLAPGMTMEIKLIHQSVQKQELSILLQSIFSENNQEFVWVVDTVGNTIKKQPITTSKLNEEGRIIVTQGLTGNETIVTAGVHKLQDGQKIKVIEN